jgi:hypothetical protein
MTTETLRNDMRMLELGINMSNRAKRENLIPKRGNDDPQKAKRFKNLKAFLRKQRGILHYKQGPSYASRVKLNKTRL